MRSRLGRLSLCSVQSNNGTMRHAEFKAAFTVTNDMINEQVDRVNNFHDKLEASFS